MKEEREEKELTSYPPTPTGLTIFWLEVLERAHGGDEPAISSKLRSLKLSPEHMAELFGPSQGARVYAEYERAFEAFAEQAPTDLAQKIRERRYDDVEIIELSEQRPDQLLANDKKTLAAVRTNTQLFNVRLKRSEEDGGIRIDTFAYLEGGWRAALKIGRLL